MVFAGFFDFALHDFAEALGGGGEALEIVEAGIVEVGGSDFARGAWLFTFVFLFFWL